MVSKGGVVAVVVEVDAVGRVGEGLGVGGRSRCEDTLVSGECEAQCYLSECSA
jgi:hypothetical protein